MYETRNAKTGMYFAWHLRLKHGKGEHGNVCPSRLPCKGRKDNQPFSKKDTSAIWYGLMSDAFNKLGLLGLSLEEKHFQWVKVYHDTKESHAS